MPVAKRASKKSTRKFTPGFRRLPLASLRVFPPVASRNACEDLLISVAKEEKLVNDVVL